VGRTFAIGVNRLNKEDKTDRLALDLLARAACFAPGELIPREVLKASMGERVKDTLFADGLIRLQGLGLVEENDAGGISMHRLVGCFVRDTQPHDEALQAVKRVVDLSASDTNMSGYPSEMQPLLAHLQHLADRASRQEDEWSASLVNNLGMHLSMIADYTRARPYLEQALSIRKKALGGEHPVTAQSLNNLGQ
jgi:hypothetical protein